MNKRNNVTKIFLMIVLTGFIFDLTACSNSETTAAVVDTNPTPVPSETAEVIPVEVSYSIQPIVYKDASELMDTRINCLVSGVIKNPSSDWVGWIDGLKADGFTRTRFTLNASDGPAVDFEYASIEKEIPADYVDLFRQMKNAGIKTRVSLSFWDMEYRSNGGQISKDRLSTEEETQRYLDYVSMVVTSLNGLVDSYELWNEPDANMDFYQRITPEDYVKVASRAIPLIRSIDPQAKIVLVSTSSYTDENTPEYSMKIIQSDVIKMADAISLHTVNNDASPVFLEDYYANYDAMWANIKSVAEANGFHGEYIADELNYRSNYSLDTLQPEMGNYHPYEPEIAAKYIGRMIAINLGMNISVGTSGTNAVERPYEGQMIRNMAFLMDGLQASSLTMKVESESNNIRYYFFEDQEKNKYFIIWNDDAANNESELFPATVYIESVYPVLVTAFDPINSTMQNIRFSQQDQNIVVNELMLTDYPVIYKITE